MIIKVVRRLFSAWIVLGASFSTLPAAEDYSTWSHSQEIILNTSNTGANVTGSVHGFPVLIRLNPSNFSGFASTLAQGADVRFAKSNGAALSYEIERWVDGSNNRDTAEIWVKVDTVYGNNGSQNIVMYWGNPGALSISNGAGAFDTANGFAGVWHLGENSDSMYDATGNGFNGKKYGSTTAPGMVGDAESYTSGDYARIPGLLKSPSNVTLSENYAGLLLQKNYF